MQQSINVPVFISSLTFLCLFLCKCNEKYVKTIMYVKIFFHLFFLHKFSPMTWGMKPHIRGFCSPRYGGF